MTLPKRHAALAPLARRWIKADVSLPTIAADWSEAELRDTEAAAHCTIFALGADGASAPVHTSAIDGSVKVRARHPTMPGLEFRLVKRGDDAIAEVWRDGVRIARRALGDSVGAKPLAAGVFGSPRFSPSGDKVVWTAERHCGRAKAKGYWPEPTGAAADAQGVAEAPAAGVTPFDKFRPKRGFGETIGVEDAALVVWRWAAVGPSVDDAAGEKLIVWNGDDVVARLPPGTLRQTEWRGVPVHASFDGSETGLLFSLSLLPKRGAGLSACLNRRTLLCHLPRALPGPAVHSGGAGVESGVNSGDSAVNSERSAVNSTAAALPISILDDGYAIHVQPTPWLSLLLRTRPILPFSCTRSRFTPNPSSVTTNPPHHPFFRAQIRGALPTHPPSPRLLKVPCSY